MGISSPDVEKMTKNEELLIAVDEQDRPLGPVEKYAAHRNPATRHRAITVFLFNSNGDLLVTQRSTKKPLWPQWWDAACSTHQWWPDESAVAAAIRRLPFEIGVDAPQIPDLREVVKYEYEAEYSAEWAEHEINYLVLGTFSGAPELNRDETIAWEWISRTNLEQELQEPNHRFAPWFPLAVEELKKIGEL